MCVCVLHACTKMQYWGRSCSFKSVSLSVIVCAYLHSKYHTPLPWMSPIWLCCHAASALRFSLSASSIT